MATPLSSPSASKKMKRSLSSEDAMNIDGLSLLEQHRSTSATINDNSSNTEACNYQSSQQQPTVRRSILKKQIDGDLSFSASSLNLESLHSSSSSSSHCYCDQSSAVRFCNVEPVQVIEIPRVEIEDFDNVYYDDDDIEHFRYEAFMEKINWT